MRSGFAAASAVLALGAGLVACGGGGGDGTTTGGGGGNPEDVLACVQDAGLQATSSSGDTAVGITDSIQVEVPPNNRIIVDFFADSGQAADYSTGQQAFLSGAGGGSSEVVGDTTVVGVARSGADQELSTVKGCLGS